MEVGGGAFFFFKEEGEGGGKRIWTKPKKKVGAKGQTHAFLG